MVQVRLMQKADLDGAALVHQATLFDNKTRWVGYNVT